MLEHEQDTIAYLWQFVGRKDAFALRCPKNKTYKPQKRTITDDDLRMHLSSDGPHVGVYLINEGSETTKHGVFDLDDHDGTLDLEQVTSAAQHICDELQKLGQRPVVFRSGGGRGIHIWLLWETEQSACDVRAMMHAALAANDFADGSGGLEKREIEVFPKQDSVPKGKYGNLIALPLGRQSSPISLTTTNGV